MEVGRLSAAAVLAVAAALVLCLPQPPSALWGTSLSPARQLRPSAVPQPTTLHAAAPPSPSRPVRGAVRPSSRAAGTVWWAQAEVWGQRWAAAALAAALPLLGLAARARRRTRAAAYPPLLVDLRGDLPACCLATAAEKGVAPAGAAGPKVVGIGVTGVDYVATVDHFPAPDEKMRSTSLAVLGGGNAGNACTAMARLGLRAALVAKVGADGFGQEVLRELQGDGVDTAHVVVDPAGTTPFSYILVDAATSTRTIIHTPPAGGDLRPEAVDPAVLDGAALLYCDGRNTEAAIVLATVARGRGVPVLVEGERPRPHLDELLALADVVTTSQTFPTAWTGVEDPVPAMAEVVRRLDLRTLVTTLGKAGSVRVDRTPGDPVPADLAPFIAEVIADGQQHAAFRSRTVAAVTVSFHPSVPLAPEAVVDTTGAGDAYLGATCYGLVHGLTPRAGMRLASEVAARKCQQLGARPGLPWAADLPPELLA